MLTTLCGSAAACIEYRARERPRAGNVKRNFPPRRSVLGAMLGRSSHAHCSDRHRLCRTRLRRLLFRIRCLRHLRRQGRARRSRACSRARCRSTSPVSIRSSRATRAPAGSSFTTDLAAAVAGADAVFIAVGTPSRRGDGHADLTYVFAAAEEIARALTGYAVVVTKSTVPVGTGRKVARHHPQGAARARLRRRVEPGIPARRLGDPGFHAPRSRRHRRRERRARRTSCASSIVRST